MKQSKLAFTAAFLSLVTVSLPLFSACGSAKTETTDSQTTQPAGTETSAPAETEAPAERIFRADLPDTDWEGRHFCVLGREDPTYSQFSNFEIYAEAENADPVNDAIFRRNSALQEKYNVVIEQSLFASPMDELKKAVTSGDDLYQLAFLDLQGSGTAIQNGYFYDLYDVDYIDFTKPWWNPEVNESVSVGNRLFMTSSDFSLRDKNRAYILFYNADMAAQFDIPNLVQMVRDGKWTLEKMTEYGKMVSNDVNGNGKMDLDDHFGLVMDSYNAFAALVIGADNRIITKDENDSLIISMNNQRMVDTIDRVMALSCDMSTGFFCEDFAPTMPNNEHWEACGISFNNSRALFNPVFPHSLKFKAANCDFNYGVIPLPKYDESQEKYYTMSDIFCMLFGIPSCAADSSFSGFMLEALSAASTYTSLQAYYDICCKTKYAVNEETGEMLDLIFDGIIFDPATIYGNIGLYGILTEIPEKRQNIFASKYQKKEKSALKRIEKIMEHIGELE